MSSNNSTDSEMDVEDKHLENKERRSDNMKTCIFITIIVILAVVAIGLLIALIIVAVKKDDDEKETEGGNTTPEEEPKVEIITAKVNQVEEKKKINVEWTLSEEADNVTVSVYHKGLLLSSQTVKEDNKKIGNKSQEIDAEYGMLDIIISAAFSDRLHSHNVSVNVSSSEYNIVALGGSYAVSVFSILFPQLTDNGRIPTYVWLERNTQYNWDNLPEGMYEYPYMNDYDKYSGYCDNAYAKITEWVDELRTINNNSYFNMYYQDWRIYGGINVTYGLGLPKDKYYLHILPDGDDTTNFINRNYKDPDTAQANFDRMKGEWDEMREQIKERKCFDFGKNDYKIECLALQTYCLVIASMDENVNYLITVENPVEGNKEFINSLKGENGLKYIVLNTELEKLTESQQDDLRQLFAFSDSFFDKAEELNKKIMILVGQRDNRESNLYSYIKIMQYLYKDDYVYYYKGHPMTPTNTIKDKKENLEAANMIDLDSTIPFEIIRFFRPDIHACGYAGTSFDSVQDENTHAVFYKKKSVAYDKDENFINSAQYYKKFKIYINALPTTDAEYGAYATYTNSYVVEYKDRTKFDFSVFNMDNLDERKHYKYNESTKKYEEVPEEQEYQ